MRVRSALAILGVLALGLTACSNGGGGPEASDEPDAQPVQITISAAASLKRSFDEIAENFQNENEGIDIAQISYDGSSTLATQIIEGAPVDVFASADEKNMVTVTDAGLAVGPTIFATNTLVIAVPAGNPGSVQALADLANVTTVLCAPEVPCGNASQTLLGNANIEVEPASMEQNVSAVLQKVSAGEADAGLVYHTDVAGDDTVENIVPEGADQVVNKYPIAVVENSQATAEQAEAAQAFVDYVLSEAGQAILSEHGFGSAE
ncbi:molybdate ABC transporter substrate-binding protein [Glutamicibacter sp. MNS18]|uniref:molybdate ABC transporter substrate-binding protein n=1 Tax=Glutamicibacter sp. MNS18 TaxID=2989817 RepID=UPI0022363745|nr:molybdate ABC transporter substrate-binding protein [Glutamicibacter sp. MNS18]MCW4466900.1 molybdate ABC transporter substrate-binding protein [Glutamicibacter sp. MNS18]